MSAARRRDEDGAIALLSAILAVVLVGVAAFSVDFGAAYASKRQLQTASDAGALAAASYYAKQPGSCATLRTSTSFKSAAQTIADNLVTRNRSGATSATLDVNCNLNDQLTVGVTSSGTTKRIFGSFFGPGDLSATRTAEATVAIPSSVTKDLRPYMLCSVNVPTTFPDTTYRVVSFPGTNTPCPTANHPGNWWATDCPGDTNNGLLDNNTLNGCSTEVSIVPNQPDTQPTGPNTALKDYLLTQCPNATLNYCLGANPGTINGNGIRDAWDSLISKDVMLPVFCGETICNPAAVKDAGGNNVVYPVYKFVDVKVCGWSFGPRDSGKYNARFPLATVADPCFGADASTAGGDALLLVFKQVQVTGSTKVSTCGLAEGCDGGTRVVLLTK